ncbi:carboxylesterase 5A-like [Acanthaster planci]|uniref:Carboxylic ester hydrolase n=1 Tax=Acanthaster planci TaxID=133434 RepID=A0A8B7ZC16_ACAPL|nr:carboxylesterase 5A-like [Acanthaster planci]XP_022102517.1 carboxylesterase 5A-like [Acanthaster planci]
MEGFSLSFIILCILAVSAADEDGPVVHLGQSSAVKGFITRAVDSQTPVYNFRSIYYAAPPTGKRRFAPPARRKPFQGLSDATKFGPLCPQDIELTVKAFAGLPMPTWEMSEDCLHLNIHTPSLDVEAKLPVMVHFPGGAFANGGAGFYDGTALAANHQVVVVTVNYRLGALGFLSTGDSTLPGNYGLLDQGAALRWIASNIKKFGGDPQTLTIMGESAGAMSVHFHMLSHVNEKLFRRAIAQSGAANAPTALVRDPRELAEKLANAFHCPTENARAMVECLRQKPADKLGRVRLTKRPIEFGPVVDGFYLKDDPRAIQSKYQLPRKELLTGFNSDEGGQSILDTRGTKDFFENLSAKTFDTFLEELLYLTVPKDLPVKPLARAITKIYIGDRSLKDDDEARQTISDIVTDSMFVSPAITTANTLSHNGLSIFLYEYKHRSSFSSLPPWAKADHGDEEAYVWGEPFMEGRGVEPEKFTEEEKELSRTMMVYWTNFAKYGTPNGLSGADDDYHPVPLWPQYERSEKKYLNLGVSPWVSQGAKAEKVDFWNKLYSFWKLGRRKKDEL